MSITAQQIMKRQNEILETIKGIRTMRRGTLSKQAYPERAKRKNGKGAVGPYCLWQGTVGGRRFGKRVSGKEAQRIEQGISHRHAFEALCEEYTELSCRLAELDTQGTGCEQTLKKGLTSRSSKAGKSRG